MNAFRFLSLLTVAFSLLVFIFLANASQGRLESEAYRVLEGPEISLEPGETAQWTLDLGGERVEEAWPAAQRQPRLYLVSDSGAVLGLARVVASAHYLNDEGDEQVAFVEGGSAVVGAAEGAPAAESATLGFGPLWMNWEKDLRIDVRVEDVADASGEASGESRGMAHLEMHGQPSHTYLEARGMARTLWIVFTSIGVAGLIVLALTMRDSLAASAPNRSS